MSQRERPLEGRRALVVGGGSGIGFAAARLHAADGAHVTIAGRTLAKLEAAADLLRAETASDAIATVACDVLDAPDVRAAVAAADAGLGLHIAVTVPGGGPFRPVLGYADDELDDVIRTNVRPQFLVLKHAGAAMIRSGGGSVVAVSSTAAVFAMPWNAGYAAGKAAVDQLVRVAASELGPVGVRVNSVRPGLTETDSTVRLVQNPALASRFLEQQPIGRVGQPGDIAAAIRYLAGPESGWVTGQSLTVDGGHTLHRFPDLTDVARSSMDEGEFDAALRGEVPR
jgi:NAD(P)-dependent dehydrogenase (short-subunit alcohol dehydrogenase family)